MEVEDTQEAPSLVKPECYSYSYYDNFKQKIRDIIHKFKYFLFRKSLGLVVSKDSNSIAHAKRELVAIGYDLNDKEEGPNKWIMENLFELLAVFSTQGHSGSSAPYCISMFKKLASFEPLCPLTGEDAEWNDVSMYCGDTTRWQNNRASHVFKDKDGQAYDSQGKVFREPDGCTYTSSDSRVVIEFPYTPKTEYVDVDVEGKPINEGVDNE